MHRLQHVYIALNYMYDRLHVCSNCVAVIASGKNRVAYQSITLLYVVSCGCIKLISNIFYSTHLIVYGIVHVCLYDCMYECCYLRKILVVMYVYIINIKTCVLLLLILFLFRYGCQVSGI